MPALRAVAGDVLRAVGWSFASLLVVVSIGCGDTDECATLERLCTEQCGATETRRECEEVYEQRNQELCQVWYKAFAQRCPSGID
ncbi:MAG: hypothetical protein ACOC1F_10420, partial [Myxococcota bacterium]